MSVVSIITAFFLKSVKILEITYIIIFASYITGYPVINIF
jgi:hypothetical protein